MELVAQSDYRSAVISEDGRYRYHLSRRWDDNDWLHFIMLNPSTADAYGDDPTIRKCIGFAKRNGYGGIVVMNLFAFRATDPRELLLWGHDAVGPDNDTHLARIPHGSTVVAAWGSKPYDWNDGFRRVEAVKKLLGAHGIKWMCVRKSGALPVVRPWHPLYVKYGDLIEL